MHPLRSFGLLHHPLLPFSSRFWSDHQLHWSIGFGQACSIILQRTTIERLQILGARPIAFDSPVHPLSI
jgi:hypothetical protein